MSREKMLEEALRLTPAECEELAKAFCRGTFPPLSSSELVFLRGVRAAEKKILDKFTALDAPVEQAAQVPEGFYAWVERNMPSGTVISDPKWWANRLSRAMLATAPQPPASIQHISDEVADAARVLEWMRDPQRKPAQFAFTAGPERQAAYWIEIAQGEPQRPASEAKDAARYELAGYEWVHPEKGMQLTREEPPELEDAYEIRPVFVRIDAAIAAQKGGAA